MSMLGIPGITWLFAILGGVLLLGCSAVNLLLPVGNLDLRGAGFGSGTIAFIFAGLFWLRDGARS